MATPAEQLGQNLLHSIGIDNNLRVAAEQNLQLAAKENLALYLDLLVSELSNWNGNADVRRAAGLAAKNALVSRDLALKAETDQRWLSLAADLRDSIKQKAVSTLSTPEPAVGAVSAQLVAAIASIELPIGQWGDVMRILSEAVTNPQSAAHMKKAALEAIEFICEDIPSEALDAYSNMVLTALVAGARPEEPNEVRRAAMSALGGAIRFFDKNFKLEAERNYIMQIVCQATQSPDTQVLIKAYECLVKIMAYQYEVMAPYMDVALVGLTIVAMKSQDNDVAMQGIEFWSTVCEEELNIVMENAEAMESNQPPPRQFHNFAQAALPQIVPVLTHLLTQQEEGDDEDDWNASMAASTCLTLLTNCVTDNILPHILPFVESNIASQRWQQREAAVMAFGCVLEGPDPRKLEPIVTQALPELVNRMNDPNIAVQDTAAWTIGKVCEVMGDSNDGNSVLNQAAIDAIVPVLLHGLKKPARVASNCAYALMNLVEQLGYEYAEPENLPSFALSKFFSDIITALVQAADRPDGSSHNLRSITYDALSQFVSFTAGDTFPVLIQLIEVMLQRLESSVSASATAPSAENQELQSNLCIVLQALTRKLRLHVQPYADRMMTVYLHMFSNTTSGKQATIQEDALTAAASLIAAIGSDFMRYLPAFVPFVCQALQNTSEASLCQIGVGIVGDLARNLGEAIEPFCNQLMTLLLQALQSNTLHRSVKPTVIAAFGDVAVAIKGGFAPYASVCFEVLRQAAQVPANPDNYEQHEYVGQLREGILEGYSGIVQGTKDVQLLVPQAEFMLVFMADSFNAFHYDSMVQNVVALLGDLCDVCGSTIAPLLKQHNEWIKSALRRARASNNPQSKELAGWTNSKFQKALSG